MPDKKWRWVCWLPSSPSKGGCWVQTRSPCIPSAPYIFLAAIFPPSTNWCKLIIFCHYDIADDFNTLFCLCLCLSLSLVVAVVYLDADTIVVKSVEDLFKCGKFCANLKHSERLNSGVMVVEPSQAVFNDMMGKVKTTFSYTGGMTFASYNICCVLVFIWYKGIAFYSVLLCMLQI